MTADPSRIALVTGASRGLGYAVAARLGASEWRVVALARTVGGLEELADVIEASGGPTPTLVPLSITDEGGLQRMCLALHQRWGHVDLVVHCAADAPPLSPAPHIAEKDFDRAIDVNLRGTRLIVTMLQPLLSAAEAGRFVHVADDRAGQPFFGAYGATKDAGSAFVRSWAEENRQIGPKVTFFNPEPMPTALRARFYPGENRAVLTSCDTEAARLIADLDVG